VNLRGGASIPDGKAPILRAEKDACIHWFSGVLAGVGGIGSLSFRWAGASIGSKSVEQKLEYT